MEYKTVRDQHTGSTPRSDGLTSQHSSVGARRRKPRNLPGTCNIVAVGKRRDGGTRYWCLLHKADATAKYGVAASACRAADIPLITTDDLFVLDLDKYKGGVALWGAAPPVYDTTTQELERGIHIHARMAPNAVKEMDYSFSAVRIVSGRFPEQGFVVSEIEAVYYMVASVFGYEVKHIACSHCGQPHLDKDWFSVHPHRRHLCAGCGIYFRDTETAIGNPICGIREAYGMKKQSPRLPNRKLDIRQADFPGGIQIWGSNPAFLWTSQLSEEEGIHVHAFGVDSNEPSIDETYSEVTIDGICLDPTMVRVLMAQGVLPSLKGRVQAVDCPSCRRPQFDVGESAFSPVANRICCYCGHQFTFSGRLRKVIANPLPGVFSCLSAGAPRAPQLHDLGLAREAL